MCCFVRIGWKLLRPLRQKWEPRCPPRHQQKSLIVSTRSPWLDTEDDRFTTTIILENVFKKRTNRVVLYYQSNSYKIKNWRTCCRKSISLHCIRKKTSTSVHKCRIKTLPTAMNQTGLSNKMSTMSKMNKNDYLSAQT